MKKKIIRALVKEVKDDGSITGAIASTSSVDRDGDILVPGGWQLDNYRKNPILLWSHDPYSLPIGKVTDIKIDNDNLVFDAQFAVKENDFAAKVANLIKGGFLNAFSVGYIPQGQDEQGRTTGMELLEISVVNVPANQEALVSHEYRQFKSYLKTVEQKDMAGMEQDMASMDEHMAGMADAMKAMREAMGKQDETAMQQHMQEMESHVGAMDDTMETMSEEMMGGKQMKSVVPFDATSPAPEETAWDGAAAAESLRKWASSDGTGDVSTIDWAKYAKGFAWYDAENKETFGAYKLPHHRYEAGKLQVVWKGVAAAMAALLGSRGGVAIPDTDTDAVYGHLAKHYKQFEKEPPTKQFTAKSGRVLSEKNRTIIESAVSIMNDSIKALKDVLSAAEPPEKSVTPSANTQIHRALKIVDHAVERAIKLTKQ